MTDVPPGNGRPGDDPEPYVPSGVRRSTYTPPEAGAEPPAFDDDALADALAAQVSSYTAPIPVTPPPTPVVPEPATPPAAPEAVQPEPAATAEPAATVEPAEPEPAATVEPSPVEASPSSTLEAIERLENELRRRAEEARAAATSAPVTVEPAPPLAEPALPPLAEPAPPPPFAAETFPPPDAPRFPAPPTYLRPAPPEDVPVAPPAPVAAEPPPVSEPVDLPPPPLVEPPSLVEPPAPVTGSVPTFLPPPTSTPEPPSFGVPPGSQPVDLPPPGNADFAHLPPPIGLEPAALPPYDPSVATPARGQSFDLPAPPGELAPPATDFDALLGRGDAVPPPHPDDLGHELPPTGGPLPPPSGETYPGPQVADDDEAVDEIDRAFGPGAIAVDSTGAIDLVHPPSQPIPTQRLTDDEAALVDEEPQSHPALTVESAGAEPTALDLRAGRAARLFWLWFAANSSVISLSLGAVLFGLGMSLRQALVAVLIGVALSFLPLGLVTLAGKWSGQPTMIVSRATFGLVGNGLPALLAVISRVFWGGALLWMLAAGVARVLVDAGLDAGLGEQTWTFVALGVGFALTFVVAIFGYGLIARIQLVLSILTGLLVVGVVLITFPRLDLAAAQAVDDGPWTLLVTGVVLVFSFVGLAWVHSSADVARYQRTDGDGGSSMLWATFGATLPAFVLVAWGALLAASDPLIADGLATNPLYTIAALLPAWYPAPLIAALALGLLSGAILTIYSGGFALQALGLGIRRSGATVIGGVLVLVLAVALVLLVGDARSLIRDIATTIAVPVAAWAGIFGAEIMIRRRGFDGDSLLRRGGIYPAVRWVNLVALVVIAGIGFGLSSAELPGLDWQGYLFPFVGLPAGDPLLTSDVGVLVALVLGLLVPLVTAVPTIRRQERTLVD